ncbi:hypothetical protein [Pontibacter sp. HSC-14F20]|uniref:hypothetical protein n=1 Tax=Pontibacter sp. HSC-14F20 TaxID=2864136 RepID=UPI0021068607|nr:hypothetical protein [Pontibacter sp. HSC-14F20]
MAQRRLLPAVRLDYIRVPGNEWVADPDNRFTTIDMRGPLLILLQRAYNAMPMICPKASCFLKGSFRPSLSDYPDAYCVRPW